MAFNIRSVCALQVLVETVSLRNELLLPLSEALFLDLDLLREALAQSLFFLLELGVVQLAGTRLAKLPRFHLAGTVSLVVLLFGGVDEIQHVGTDQDRAELLEITVVLVLNLCDTPDVLTAFDNTAIVGLDVLLRTNNREWHGSHQAAGVGSSVLVILLNRGLVDLDTLSLNHSADLSKSVWRGKI